MTSRRPFRRPIFLAAALTLLAVFSASPARADRCDDSAKELANQIDKLKVNFKAANIVYMTHPLARELSVGCRGDKYSIELYAKGDRKPKPEFLAQLSDASIRIQRYAAAGFDSFDAPEST